MNFKSGRFCFDFPAILKEGNKSSLIQYGPGITSYFKFLKWSFYTFLVLTLINYVPLSILSNNFLYLDFGIENNNSIVIEGITTLVFLSSHVLLKYFEKKEKLTVGYDTISADDYSVFIQNLPQGVTRDDLLHHFRMYPINRIYLVEKNKEIYKLLKKANQELKNNKNNKNKNNINQARLELILKKIQELRMSETQDAPAIHAFVTFEKANFTDIVLKKYHYGKWWNFWTQYYDLRLQKKHRLRVLPAPSPTTVIWENLQVSFTMQIIRQFITWIMSLLILFGSFLFLAWTRQQQEEAQYGNGNGNGTIVNYNNNTMIGCETPGNCFELVKVNLYSMIGSVAVVLVNFILTQLMDFLSLFEKHHSLNSKALSTSFKLFIMQFINTSLLLLLINNNLTERIFKYPSWFETIGKSIMYSMVFNIVTPHMFQILKYFTTIASFTFSFSEKYASIYSTIFSCCLFSMGFPIMYPILTASLLVRYLVDSFLFSKLLKEKNNNIPVYTIEMQQTFSETLPFAWLFHLAIGLWMYLANDNVENNINKTSFLKVTCFALLLVLVLYYLVNDTMLHFLTCGFHRRKKKRQDRKLDLSNMLTYSEALENGIVGTYSMLELPEYRKEFESILSFSEKRDRGNTELSHVIDVFLIEKEEIDEKREMNREEK